VRLVGHLEELYRNAPSTEHKIRLSECLSLKTDWYSVSPLFLSVRTFWCFLCGPEMRNEIL